MKNNINFIVFSIILGLSTTSLSATLLFEYQNDRIELDDVSGDIILTYDNDEQVPVIVRWISPTKFSAEIKSKIKIKDNMFEYNYSIKSDNSSKQKINTIFLDAKQVFESSVAQPNTWNYLSSGGDATIPQDERMAWNTKKIDDGIKPGKTGKYFSFISKSLPSIGHINLEGGSYIPSFPDSGPQFKTRSFIREEIHKKHMNGKSFLVIAPSIKINNTTTITEILQAMYSEVEGYKKYGTLDVLFVNKLKSLLLPAINASLAGDTRLTLDYLKDLKEYIEGEDDHDEIKKDKESDDQNIFKLIRKSLTFNIQYIKKMIR